MIQHVDDTLYHLFATGLTTLRPTGGGAVTVGQIGFQPPDATWRSGLPNLGRKAINVYLTDVRENRRLRTNERIPTTDPATGFVTEEPAPARADCHYLITAWSPADEDTVTADHIGLGRTGEEHEILYEITALLLANQPLIPAQVFGTPPFGPPIAGAILPTTLLPIDGFPKYAEFWGTMGDPHPWKPAIWLVVTVPVALPTRPAGPMVTTVLTEFDIGETPIDVGGHVLVGSAPVADAWVRLETPAGHLLQSATSDAAGQFRFTRLTARSYRFRAGAGGVGTADRTLDVPSPSGEYDLHLS